MKPTSEACHCHGIAELSDGDGGVELRLGISDGRRLLTILFSALPLSGLNDTIPSVLCHVRAANVLFWGADTKVRWAPLFRTRPRV
jgi:hypothetical protein